MKLTRFQRPEFRGGSFDDQLNTLRDEINQLFENPFGTLSRYSEVFNSWSPLLDVYEDKDNVYVKAELPGMTKEQIDLSLHQNALTISGERSKESKQDQGEVTRAERFFGRFQRSISLPKSVDSSKVAAVYQDGILTVTLPKTEESKPRQIEVQVS